MTEFAVPTHALAAGCEPGSNIVPASSRWGRALRQGSGMPAWRDHSDEELWTMVALIEKQPGMTEQD